MVYSTRRFVLYLTLCYFVLVFFSPFSITITSLRLFGFVCFLFLLVSGKGCSLWLLHSLNFSLTFFYLIASDLPISFLKEFKLKENIYVLSMSANDFLEIDTFSGGRYQWAYDIYTSSHQRLNVVCSLCKYLVRLKCINYPFTNYDLRCLITNMCRLNQCIIFTSNLHCAGGSARTLLWCILDFLVICDYWVHSVVSVFTVLVGHSSWLCVFFVLPKAILLAFILLYCSWC